MELAKTLTFMKDTVLKRLLLTGISVLPLGGYASAIQATWYVDVNGLTTGSGTLADPFPAIQTALSNPLLFNGDRILVAPGTYVEDIEFQRMARVESLEGPDVTIIAPSTLNSRVVTFLNGLGSATRLQGFTIQGNRQAGGTSTGVFVGYPDRAGTIVNCIVRGHQRAALNRYDLNIVNCTIVDNAEGLETTVSSFYIIRDSILWDNGTTFTGTRPDSPNIDGSLVDVDPLFFQPGLDFHISRVSPAIDIGVLNRTDLDGSLPDAGVYAWDPSYPVGRSECMASANSTGLPGRLSSLGSAQMMSNDLVLLADQLPPSQATLLVVGDDRAAVPLGNGTLCIAGQTARLSLALSNAAGDATFDLDNGSPQLAGLVSPGVTLHFQAWHRDPVGPAFFNLTHAVRVTFTL